MAKSKFYILAGLASILWDPAQSKKENQTIIPGQVVKDLDKTNKVQRMIGAGTLVETDEDAYKAWQAKQKKDDKPTTSGNNDEFSKLVNELDQASSYNKAAQSKISTLEEEKKKAEQEKEEALKKLTELEKQQAEDKSSSGKK